MITTTTTKKLLKTNCPSDVSKLGRMHKLKTNINSENMKLSKLETVFKSRKKNTELCPKSTARH